MDLSTLRHSCSHIMAQAVRLKKAALSTLILIAVLVCASNVFAETIYLKSGKIIEGKIIEKTDKHIKIDFYGTPLTYYLEDIKSIDGKDIGNIETREKTAAILEEKSGVQIFKDLSPAVVYVQAGGSQGSGFIIDKQGIFVTNWHVIGSSKDITVSLKGGATYPVTSVLNYDILKDICIMKIEPPSEVAFIPLGEYESIEIGQTAYVIGNPAGLEHRISDGIVAQKENDPFRGKIIQFTCPISPGSSGSPLLNSRGEAIGMAMSSIVTPLTQNLNFAISSNEIKALLAEDRRLSLADFAGLNKNSGIFQQGQRLVAEGKPVGAYRLYKEVFQTKCNQGNIDEKDCVELLSGMLAVIGGEVGEWGQRYPISLKSILSKREAGINITKEEMDKADFEKGEMLGAAQEMIGLIENCGGLRKVYDKLIDARFFSPAESKSLQESLPLGYFNAANAAAFDNQPDLFYAYFKKIQEAFPETETVRLLSETEQWAKEAIWQKK